MKRDHVVLPIAGGIWLGLIPHLGALDAAEESGRVWREDLDSLDAWQPLTFPKMDRRSLDSPYTGRSKMIILQAGKERLGEWVEEDVHILEDYRAAFGEDPPQAARLAIMSDADNTGGTAMAFLDLIELAPPPRQEATE